MRRREGESEDDYVVAKSWDQSRNASGGANERENGNATKDVKCNIKFKVSMRNEMEDVWNLNAMQRNKTKRYTHIFFSLEFLHGTRRDYFIRFDPIFSLAIKIARKTIIKSVYVRWLMIIFVGKGKSSAPENVCLHCRKLQSIHLLPIEHFWVDDLNFAFPTPEAALF